MSDTALKIWNAVPDGSTLEMWLESDEDAWAGSARLVISEPDGGRREESWTHDELHRGPKRRQLAAPNGYTVRVRVGFTGSDRVEVTVRARIVKPDGSQYGSDYAYPVAGVDPEVERATVIAVTKKGSG